MRPRLRAIVRVREAVAVGDAPQLERGQDEPMREREFSTGRRVDLAKAGHAIPVRNKQGDIVGGRYPIETDEDVKNAVHDVDRSGGGAEEKAHVAAQAERLGVMGEIPDEWKSKAPKPGKAPKGPKAAKKPKPKPAREAEAVRFRVELREAGVTKSGNTYEATIIREGPGNSSDANAYTREALRKGVAAGLFDGLQAYANHPTASEERERPERDVRQLVGHFREAKYSEDGGVGHVRAKFVPITGAGYEWVTSLIESALKAPAGKPLIGISIDGYGHAPDRTEINGRTYNAVREIIHLGSADIVTRAGAGGQFHRRLQESLGDAWEVAGDSPVLSVRKLQKRLRRGLRLLESGLVAEDVDGVRDAFVSLREAATATVKPVADTAAGGKALRAENRLAKERKRRRLAESRADLADRGTLAGRLLREVDAPADVRDRWFADLVERPDETAMRDLLDRRKAERDAIVVELREAAGLNRIEGNPRRDRSAPAGPPPVDLLDRIVGRDNADAFRSTQDI